MILVIDNYDSFTFNLVQYLGALGANIKVYRNDRSELLEIEHMNPRGMIVSPGPGRPENAGYAVRLITQNHTRFPILGVCLGHQAIAAAFGGSIILANRLMHGKTSNIYHTGECIFDGVSSPFIATRYHSLIVDRQNFPVDLIISAETKDGTIMGLQHKSYPLFGVQFHPESILTKMGKKLLKNFLDICEQN